MLSASLRAGTTMATCGGSGGNAGRPSSRSRPSQNPPRANTRYSQAASAAVASVRAIIGEATKEALGGCPARQIKGLRPPVANAIGFGRLTRNAPYGLPPNPRPADFHARNGQTAGPSDMNDVTDAGATFRQRLDGVAADTERLLERLL